MQRCGVVVSNQNNGQGWRLERSVRKGGESAEWVVIWTVVRGEIRRRGVMRRKRHRRSRTTVGLDIVGGGVVDEGCRWGRVSVRQSDGEE
jgi:hypothetical protein